MHWFHYAAITGLGLGLIRNVIASRRLSNGRAPELMIMIGFDLIGFCLWAYVLDAGGFWRQ